ncbi:MAG: site-2 protease family protein [Nitrososphaerales archaeon]
MTSAGFSEQRSVEQTQFVIEAVRRRFVVTQEYLREGQALEFYLDQNQKETKQSFLSLLDELGKTGDSAILRNTDHGLLLIVFRKLVQKKERRLNRPLILLIATVITIFADGVFRAYGYSDQGSPLSLTQDFNTAMIYTVALLGIIGIHEMGHKVASWYHKMDSSWPYFIPGIPSVWPTMGAFISAREPPRNKDSLFDLGLSGPIAGLIVTIIVSFFAVASASAHPTGVDYYTSFLSSLLVKGNQSSGYWHAGPTFSVLYFGYSIGFLLTFVNLLPAWQLDGGHISNSFVSPRAHRYLTWASAVIMVLAGFWLMAFLVIFLAGKAPALRPLDDVSKLSSRRKFLFWLTWILSATIYLFAIYGNGYFGITQVL